MLFRLLALPGLKPKACPGRVVRPSASFHHGPVLCHQEDAEARPDSVRVTFITKEGEATSVQGRVGERVLYLAHRKGIEMEGACEVFPIPI